MIEHDRLDADEAPVADRAAVQDDRVAHRDIVAERQGNTVIGMQDRAILHVGACPDHDRIVVSSDHDVEPDRSAIFENDTPDHRGVGCDVMAAAPKLDATIGELEQHAAT